MKPRNKHEKAMLALHNKLPDITRRQTAWAIDNCMEHYAFRNSKGEALCMDCGNMFKLKGTRKRKHATCPHCKKKLEIFTTKKRNIKQKNYFNIITTHKNKQLLRMFEIRSLMRRKKEAQYEIREIAQFWWDEKGKLAIIARRRLQGIYVDTFNWCYKMSIQKNNAALQHIASFPAYPVIRAIPLLKRNGLRSLKYNNPNFTDLISGPFSNPKYEILLKNGQMELLDEYTNLYTGRIDSLWPEIRICMRHKHIIRQFPTWSEMIHNMKYLGLDTHNPKLICLDGDTLQTRAEQIDDKANRARAAEAQKERIREALQYENQYREDKGRFFGLCIVKGDIRIEPLRSVTDFIKEGDELHHCVANYYKKKDSLILSATVNRKRTETIEINLPIMQVTQCRGLFNTSSPYHDEILSTIKENLYKIQELQ